MWLGVLWGCGRQTSPRLRRDRNRRCTEPAPGLYTEDVGKVTDTYSRAIAAFAAGYWKDYLGNIDGALSLSGKRGTAVGSLSATG